MFTTFDEAVEYLQKNLEAFDPTNPIDEDETSEMLFDAVFTKIDDDTLEKSLTDSDRTLLQSGEGDEDTVIGILANRIPNFYTILNHTVAEIIDEYTSDEVTEE